jgi:hypothetical protein
VEEQKDAQHIHNTGVMPESRWLYGLLFNGVDGKENGRQLVANYF